MIVQCPHCATRYKMDETKLAGNARMKCSRCQNVFPAPSTKKRVAPAPTKPTLAAAQTLRLPFDDSPAKDNPLGESARAPLFDIGAAADAADEGDEDAHELRLPKSGATKVMGEIESPDDPFGGDEPENDDDGFEISEQADTYTLGNEDVAPLPPRRPPPRARPTAAPRVPKPLPRAARPDRVPSGSTSERGKFRAIFVFQAITVVIYAVLFQAMLASPALTDDVLQKIPFIGTFRNDKLMARKIALSGLSGAYQRIKEGREVFVVRGSVLNTAPVPLQSVQIAGKLYDTKGVIVDTKTIFCGSVISTKVLKDLTTPELSMLQPPYPPKHFAIEPGDSKSFVMVFTDPPREAAEFSTQVVSAQRQS